MYKLSKWSWMDTAHRVGMGGVGGGGGKHVKQARYQLSHPSPYRTTHMVYPYAATHLPMILRHTSNPINSDPLTRLIFVLFKN